MRAVAITVSSCPKRRSDGKQPQSTNNEYGSAGSCLGQLRQTLTISAFLPDFGTAVENEGITPLDQRPSNPSQIPQSQLLGRSSTHPAHVSQAERISISNSSLTFRTLPPPQIGRLSRILATLIVNKVIQAEIFFLSRSTSRSRRSRREPSSFLDMTASFRTRFKID